MCTFEFPKKLELKIFGFLGQKSICTFEVPKKKMLKVFRFFNQNVSPTIGVPKKMVSIFIGLHYDNLEIIVILKNHNSGLGQNGPTELHGAPRRSTELQDYHNATL